MEFPKGTTVKVNTDKWDGIPDTPRRGNVGVVSDPGTPLWDMLHTTPVYFRGLGDIWFFEHGEITRV